VLFVIEIKLMGNQLLRFQKSFLQISV